MISREGRQNIIDTFIKLNPHTKNDKFIYRIDRNCIEWICSHGIGHPIWDAHNYYVHGCDGCCSSLNIKGMRDEE